MVWERPAAVLPRSYVDSVAAAGGVPVLLPPVPAGAVEAVSALDALVLAGGADVEPHRYGEDPHASTVSRQDRDAWELALLRAALDRDLPVLAICRGMQLLNVAAAERCASTCLRWSATTGTSRRRGCSGRAGCGSGRPAGWPGYLAPR